jgi:hypothetical protein
MATSIRILTLIALIAVLAIGCEKEEQLVEYRITKSISGFDVNYRDASGNLITQQVNTSSAEDTWSYSYSGEAGDIVFVSAKYDDINSSIKVQILIDQKVYKEGSSTNDTIKYVTVSGTVPY